MTELANSMRGVIFMWFLLEFVGFFYWLGKLLEGRYVLMDEYYQGEVPRPQGTAQVIVEPGQVVGQVRPPPVVEVRSPCLVRFVELWELFLYDYLPFLGMAVLNVVIIRSWAFNLVELFLVLIPMWLFNVLKLVPPRYMILSLITKFWWSGWMLGFFINIWTIKTY